jgi:hypothetical protein
VRSQLLMSENDEDEERQDREFLDSDSGALNLLHHCMLLNALQKAAGRVVRGDRSIH